MASLPFSNIFALHSLHTVGTQHLPDLSLLLNESKYMLVPVWSICIYVKIGLKLKATHRQYKPFISDGKELNQ